MNPNINEDILRTSLLLQQQKVMFGDDEGLGWRDCLLETDEDNISSVL
jgi:hypothetical protein